MAIESTDSRKLLDLVRRFHARVKISNANGGSLDRCRICDRVPIGENPIRWRAECPCHETARLLASINDDKVVPIKPAQQKRKDADAVFKTPVTDLMSFGDGD